MFLAKSRGGPTRDWFCSKQKRNRSIRRITGCNDGGRLPLKTLRVTRRCRTHAGETFPTAFFPSAASRTESPWAISAARLADARRIDPRERDRKLQLFTRSNDPPPVRPSLSSLARDFPVFATRAAAERRRGVGFWTAISLKGLFLKVDPPATWLHISKSC